MSRPLRKSPRDQTVTTSIRMPVELRAMLQAEAEANDRNLSQESVRRLRLSFQNETGATPNGCARPKGLFRESTP